MKTLQTTVAAVILVPLLFTVQGLPAAQFFPGNCVASCTEREDGDYQSCNGCHVYVTCSNGAPIDNRSCPASLVWDDSVKRCVFTSTTCIESSDLPTGHYVDPLAGTCPAGYSGLLPDPENCARYYLCAQGVVVPPSETRAVRECPYPYLFSSELLDCSYFTEVTCDNRTEPKAPCDYFGPVQTLDAYGSNSRSARSAGRQGSSHSGGPPCEVHLPPCMGLPDGPNPWMWREDSPYYVECQAERTIRTKHCPNDYITGKTMVFLKEARQCVSVWDLPKDKGGRQPSCFQKPNGYYPDEESWCPFYYECRDGLHQGFYRCPDGLYFSGLSGKCESGEFVPAPCGGAGTPNCQRQEDGLYPDAQGRCPFFMLCNGGQVRGVFKCANPGYVLNLNTGKCDTPENSPKPCGRL